MAQFEPIVQIVGLVNGIIGIFTNLLGLGEDVVDSSILELFCKNQDPGT